MTDPTTEIVPIHAEGTAVRVSTLATCGDPSIDQSAARPSREYVIDSYCPPGEGDDPAGRAYYLLDAPGSSFGGNYWTYPEHVEVIRTVEQQAARKPPGQADLRDAVASALHSAFTGIEVHQTDNSGNDRIYVQARTDDGLEFQFRVTVDEIERVEW